MSALLLAVAPSAEPTGAGGAAASVAIDPTVLALLSIFGGALLTAAAAAWGGLEAVETRARALAQGAAIRELRRSDPNPTDCRRRAGEL